MLSDEEEEEVEPDIVRLLVLPPGYPAPSCNVGEVFPVRFHLTIESKPVHIIQEKTPPLHGRGQDRPRKKEKREG